MTHVLGAGVGVDPGRHWVPPHGPTLQQIAFPSQSELLSKSRHCKTMEAREQKSKSNGSLGGHLKHTETVAVVVYKIQDWCLKCAYKLIMDCEPFCQSKMYYEYLIFLDAHFVYNVKWYHAHTPGVGFGVGGGVGRVGVGPALHWVAPHGPTLQQISLPSQSELLSKSLHSWKTNTRAQSSGSNGSLGGHL